MRDNSDWFASAVRMRDFNAMYPRSGNLPSSDRVIWVTDQPGNGLCVPKDKELSEWMMQNYGFDGVAYAYGEPDFEPFVETIRPEDLMSEDFAIFRQEKHNRSFPQVTCDAVDGVHCQFSTDDTISTNRAVNKKTCFDRIADSLGGNVNGQVVEDYFSYKGLTCHEPSDLHTLQVIPSRINSTFSHTGGVSTMMHSDQFMDTEREEPDVKVLRRSLDDSPHRAHDNRYEEVYDSFALPFDRPLTQQELDGVYKRDQVYVDGMHQMYGDGYAWRDNGVTADYGTLEGQLREGYETTSNAIAAGDGGQYVDGFDRFNEAHQQINTDYYMTRLQHEQAADQSYGEAPEYDETQSAAQEQNTDQLYGMDAPQEGAPTQDAAQEQSTDQLYGVDQQPEQEAVQEQSNDQLYGVDQQPEQETAQEQSNDQLYGLDQEQDREQAQDPSQEQANDQLYGVDPAQEQAAERDYGAQPQQNEQNAPQVITANEEPNEDISNDMTY